MPPRLTTEQLAALQPGDRVSRCAAPGVWETAQIERVTNAQATVTWPSSGWARYWRDSGQRVGVPGEYLREPKEDLRMTPERWREVLHVHLRDEMARHQFSEREEIVLGCALADESNAACLVLRECERVGFEPMDTAALIVRTVLARRLAEAQHAPAREESPDPFGAALPDWAQPVVRG